MDIVDAKKEKIHSIFKGFQIRYEVANFINGGKASEITKLSDRSYEGVLPIFRWMLNSKREEMRNLYPENLVRRAKEINDRSPMGLSQEILSMMVEIVRIIRYDMIDSIPGMRQSILEAFDAMPLEHKDFDLHSCGHVYFPEMWHGDMGQEIFGKFVANLAITFELTEAQKDRIQFVLKKYRDKEVFNGYIFSVLMQRMHGREPRQMPFEKNANAYVKMVVDLLKPKTDMIGEYNTPKLLEFIDTFDKEKLFVLRNLYDAAPVHSLEPGYFYKMFCEYAGIEPVVYRNIY